MHVLLEEHINSLKNRGYINNQNKSLIPIENFDKLSKIHISPTHYITLFSGLRESDLKLITRYLIINWNLIAEQMKDDKYHIQDPKDLCLFFLNPDFLHRMYFFTNAIHNYFFP